MIIAAASSQGLNAFAGSAEKEAGTLQSQRRHVAKLLALTTADGRDGRTPKLPTHRLRGSVSCQ